MRIAPEHIQEKSIAGATKDGSPIVFVLTKGGLNAFFTKKDKDVVTLSAAPHKAIAMWLAEQKSPGISWDSTFTDSTVRKSEQDRFDQVRSLLFTSAPSTPIEDVDAYILYDTNKKIIDIMTEEEAVEAIKKGEHVSSLIRPINLSAPVDTVRDHKFYRRAREQE